MMKKIIIIDDRKERIRSHSIDLVQFQDLLDRGYITKIESLNTEDSIDSILDSYSIIAVHGTYLSNNENLSTELKEYVKNNDKLLVIFSGGITQVSISDSGKALQISSAEFYSNKLIWFSYKYCEGDDNQVPLLKFVYGKNWKLSLLLQYRYILWYFGDDVKIHERFYRDKKREIETILWPEGNAPQMAGVEQLLEQEKLNKISL